MSMTDCNPFLGRVSWATCRKGTRRVLVLGILPIFLAACSVPDYVNPVNWFESKEKKQEIAAAKPVPGKDKTFPKLSSVPDRPDPITIARIRKELTEGLIGDSINARYTDEIIRRESPAPVPRPIVAAKSPPPAPKKLTTVKPPPPPKLVTAPQPPASTTAAQVTTSVETTAVPPVPSNLQIAASSAKQSAKVPVAARIDMPPLPASTAKLAGPQSPPPPPQIAALSRPAPEPSSRPIQLKKIAAIFFGSATASLTEDDVLVLEKVAALQLESGGRVRVVGHSSRGAPSSNQLKQRLSNFKLSLDRANVVAEALIRFGVAGDHVDVIARGDGELLYAETTPAGAAGNRRTEIFLELF